MHHCIPIFDINHQLCCLFFNICRIRRKRQASVRRNLFQGLLRGVHWHKYLLHCWNNTMKTFDIKEVISYFLFVVKVPFIWGNHLLHVEIISQISMRGWKYGELEEARVPTLPWLVALTTMDDIVLSDSEYILLIPTVSTLVRKIEDK